MKQFIVLLLVIAAGYYFYTHGLQQTFKKINLEPEAIVQESVKENKNTAVAPKQETGLPEIAPERSSGLKMDNRNMNLLETTVFNTYDAKTCFAYVEMVYASGSSAASKVINKYLATFDLAEDRNKIIPLITKYKDKQSLKILEDLKKRGYFSKKILDAKIAEYDAYEAKNENRNTSLEDTDKNASGNDTVANDEKHSLADEAKDMYSEIVNWNKMEAGKKVSPAKRLQGLMDDPQQGEYQ